MKQEREQLERILQDVYCRVLELPEVGIDEDFFVLGGHSLLVVRLTHALHTEGLEFDYDFVFEGRTIRGVVDLMLGATSHGRT